MKCEAEAKTTKNTWFTKIKSAKTVLLSWLAATGLIASTTTCPLCGQSGCPTGIASAAGLGGLAAAILMVLRKLGWKKAVSHPEKSVHPCEDQHHGL